MTSGRSDDDNRRRLALVVAYDGIGYAGFQWQANAPTIQGELETAIQKLTGEPTRIRGASRTDAGAHACRQVVDFLTGKPYRSEVFYRALNHHLPDSIRVLQVAAVPLAFHSRRSAAWRSYRYRILNRATPSPLLRHSHYWTPAHLDLTAINRAAKHLLGVRDFRQVALGHPPDRSAVRRVHHWHAHRNAANANIIAIDCQANGFLRHQIRRINAILLEIAQGRLPPHAIADALAGRPTGHRHIRTLPAHGLCLTAVHYPEYHHLLKVTNHDETH